MSVKKVHHSQTRYNGETEEQIIQAAERLYAQGQFKKAIERIAPVYFAYKRAGKLSKLPRRALKLFFPMPLEYLKFAVNSLPANIRSKPPEQIAEFLLTQFSMMRQESVMNPYAHNRRTGARGLGQILPKTASWFAWLKWRMNSFDLYRPPDNIKIMGGYLEYLFRKRNGNRQMTAASYNAGPNRVARYIREHHGPLTPAELRRRNHEAGDYVAIVGRNFIQYSSLYGNRVLLMAQGLSICKPAPQALAKIKPKDNHVFRVQLASFRSFNQARNYRAAVAGMKSRIEVVRSNGQKWFRVVRVFREHQKATTYLKWAKNNGFRDAWIPG